MADTETALSSIPTPHTSSFKGLWANFPLFMDRLNSPSRPGPFPATGHKGTDNQDGVLEYLISFGPCVR